MFERFTDRARCVVVFAQEEARMLNHAWIGTEHLLLGLVREGEGVAAQALQALGVALETVRAQVEAIIGRGELAPTGHVPFAPRAKKVLELSLREALKLGHAYIGTEHILLGLVREGEGVAAQVLQKLGADLNRVRQEVVRLLSGRPAEAERSRGLRAAHVDLLEKLTDAALEGLLAARLAARRSGAGEVDVTHLLVGVLAVEGGAAARELINADLSVERLRGVLGSGAAQTEAGDAAGLPLSARARRVLQMILGAPGPAVGTGHLAARLMGEEAVADLLCAAGTDVNKARHAARRLAGEGGLP